MSLDEADRVREGVIRWQRRVIGGLLAVLVTGTLAAILGGPTALQALQALQGIAGLVSP